MPQRSDGNTFRWTKRPQTDMNENSECFLWDFAKILEMAVEEVPSEEGEILQRILEKTF